MPVAFLKDVSGEKRLRVVKSGFNADTLTLAQNNVIFDSKFASAGGVFYIGSYNVVGAVTDALIYSYANLGGIPAVFVVIKNTVTGICFNVMDTNSVTTGVLMYASATEMRLTTTLTGNNIIYYFMFRNLF